MMFAVRWLGGKAWFSCYSDANDLQKELKRNGKASFLCCEKFGQNPWRLQ